MTTRAKVHNIQPEPRLIGAFNSQHKSLIAARFWIYVYFFLLLFEGALRKWVFYSFPLISGPVLIIRDPVALLIYWNVWNAHRWPRSTWIYILSLMGACITLLSAVQLLTGAVTNPIVIIYGLRSYLLHIPLILVIPSVMGEREVAKIGQWIIRITPFMTILMIAQFIVPADHFLNRATIEGGEQIRSEFDKVRMAGTFSYNTGAGKFYLLATAFTFYSYVRPRWISQIWRVAALVSIVTVLPISGSRTLVLSFVVTMGFAVLGGIFNHRLLVISLRLSVALVIIGILLISTAVFRQGIEVFSTRWDEGLGERGSFTDAILKRSFNDFSDAFSIATQVPPLGRGVGLGSNVAAKLITGDLDFLLAEAEWPRTVLEMGPIVGFSWLAFRCSFAVMLLCRTWASLRSGNTLGWLLLSTCILDIIYAPMEQAMMLGFLSLVGGLSLAASNRYYLKQLPDANNGLAGL